DYLLKPFTASRFHAALDRARLEVARAGDHETHQRLIEVLDERRRDAERAGDHETHQRLIEVLDERRRARERRSSQEFAAGEGYLARLAVKHNERIVLVKTADVDWIESCANYAHLHTHGKSYVVRMTMGDLE